MKAAVVARHLYGIPERRRGSFDRDYWLSHCDGFRVDGSEGQLGVVEDVRPAGDGEVTLAVRAGMLGRRLLLVPAGEVASIVPRDRHIWLRSPTTIAGSEPV